MRSPESAFDLRAALSEELTAAIDELDASSSDFRAVHRCRVRVKRARALARVGHSGAPGLSGVFNDTARGVMRMLAQEDRFPACRAVTDLGKAMHRQWITRAFRPWLDPLEPEARRRTEDALVIAGDLYVWKLMRRDMQRPLSEYRDVMETMLATAIGVPRAELFGETEGEAG